MCKVPTLSTAGVLIKHCKWIEKINHLVSLSVIEYQKKNYRKYVWNVMAKRERYRYRYTHTNIDDSVAAYVL